MRVVLNVRPVARSDVRGRVVDGGGHGVEGAKARLLRASWKSGKEDCTVSPEIEAVSVGDGAFVLRNVPHGTAAFVVKHAAYSEREVELNVPGPLPDLTLAAGTTWKGRILRPDGSILEKCEIGLTIRNPPASRAAACSPTGFILDHLPPGRAELRISTRGKGGDAQLGSRVLLQDVQIQPNERRQDDFRWPAGETIAGRVVTSDGVPVPDAAVFAEPSRIAGLRDGSGYGVGTRSDREGRFAFRHLLASGDWVIEVRAGGHRDTRFRAKTGSMGLVVTVIAKGGAR